jgi:hypothetical protein
MEVFSSSFSATVGGLAHFKIKVLGALEQPSHAHAHGSRIIDN